MLQSLKKSYKIVFVLALALLLFFLDFWSKSHIYNVMPFFKGPEEGLPILTNFLGGIDFSLSLAFNRGAAWGLLSEFQFPLLLFRIFIVSILLVYLIFFNAQKNMVVPMVLIITGAIGNIADFFLYGFVIDFLRFTFWGWEFPLFNLADSMITIGVFFILLRTCFEKKKSKQLS
jgi:signal peptidase II